jgi:hypothetical protein
MREAAEKFGVRQSLEEFFHDPHADSFIPQKNVPNTSV